MILQRGAYSPSAGKDIERFARETEDNEKPDISPIILDSWESETESVFGIPDDDNSPIFLHSEESETESVFGIPDDEKRDNSPIFLDSEEIETETESDIFEIPDDVGTPSYRKRKARSQPQAWFKKTKSSTTGNRPEPKRDVHAKVKRKLQKLLKKEGEHKAVKEAMGFDFETENPIFLLTMRPFHIKISKAYIPQSFDNKYFPSTKGKVIFQNIDGRTWTVKYKVDLNRRLRLSIGWGQFVRDNKLRLDDVCIFELIKRDEPTFKFNIYHEIPIEKKHKEDFSEVLHPTPLRITPLRMIFSTTAQALKAARLFKSGDPFFHVVMTHGYVQGENVVIPKDFCACQNFTNSVQLEVDKDLWLVVMTHKDGVYQFSKGWDVFAKYHDLRVGDVCVFQMTNSDYVLHLSLTGFNGCLCLITV